MRDFTVPGSALTGFYSCWRWLIPKFRAVSAMAGTYVLVGLLFLWMPSEADAQEVTLNTSIQAGFGIDADIESDKLSFQVNGLDPVGTDDWFDIPQDGDPDGNPMTGAGVIEFPSMEDFQKLQDGVNETFELRMSADLYSVPENDGIIWIDAVYYRDQRTDGDKKDMTVFDQPVNKNYNDPTTWTFKTGDVPQKNDIIDVFGHLRRAADGDEYAIVAASTRNADGDSYLDFEYYREKVTLNASKTRLITAGEDCGHTAYEFDLVADAENDGDGSVLEHGDIIMSVNYTRGGEAVDIRLFVWIDKRDFPTNQDFADFNLLPERPFNFGNAIGDFVFYPCDNDPSKNFGYARISLKNNAQKLAVFAQSNSEGPVPAPEWGTINDAGDVVDFYQTNTFAELALNATLFGFDTQSDNVLCDNPLGSVIVKSRSSDAFTSSLKDFAGPFDLGDTPPVTVSVENGSYECFETSTTLTATVTPETGTFKYQWYELIGEAYVEIEGATSAVLENATAGTYKVKATIQIGGNDGCFGEAEGISVIQQDPAEPLQALCPMNVSLDACTPQTEIDDAFGIWKNSLSYEGGGGDVTVVYYLNDQVVDNLDRLTPPDFCGGSVTIGISVTDECEQQSSCSTTFSIAPDETPVALDPIEGYMLEGCNADWPEFLTTGWTDNCGVGGETSGNLNSDGGGEVSTDGCIQSRVYTFSVTDDCENESSMTVTVSREFDETPVALDPIEDYMLEGCNADWPEFLTTGWTDTCGVGGETSGNLNSDGGGEVSTDGCIQSRVYTFSVTDDCENESSMTVTVSREFDETKPVIVPPSIATVCETEVPASLTASWTDNCSDGGDDLVAYPELAGSDECSETYNYTFSVTDDCGNTAEETITVVREFELLGECETIFGYDEGTATCFSEYGFNRWGWTHLITENSGSTTLDLYAGAAQCDIGKGAYAGMATITYEDGYVTVEYNMASNYVLNEAHVYIGCEPVPSLKNGKETVAPGQYPFNPELGGGVSNYTVGPVAAEGDVYVIVHGVACEVLCQCTDGGAIFNGNEGGQSFDGAEFDCDESATVSNGNENNGRNNRQGETAKVKAFPVPFKETVNLQYDFDYTSDVTIEVFDIRGQHLRTYTDKKVSKGSVSRLQVDFTMKANQMYILKITTDRETFVEQIVSSKK